MGRRASPQTRVLLAALLDHPREWKHGYDLSKCTGLKSGTLYPILMRLAEQGVLHTEWRESDEPGRPPRHVYRLTADGLEMARADPDSRPALSVTLTPAKATR